MNDWIRIVFWNKLKRKTNKAWILVTERAMHENEVEACMRGKDTSLCVALDKTGSVAARQ